MVLNLIEIKNSNKDKRKKKILEINIKKKIYKKNENFFLENKRN